MSAIDITKELDEWAFDLECDLKSGNYENRGVLQKKLIKLITLRDKYYEIHKKQIAHKNRTTAGVRYCVLPKYSSKRVSPLVPPKIQSGVRKSRI